MRNWIECDSDHLREWVPPYRWIRVMLSNGGEAEGCAKHFYFMDIQAYRNAPHPMQKELAS